MEDKIFITNRGEIEGRMDPYYYKPEFERLVEALKTSGLALKRLGDISEDIKNGSTPTGGSFENEGIPYFRSQDFSLYDFEINQFITLKFHKKIFRSAIKGGDVLIAVVGATLGVIGYVPDSIKEANINQNVARIRVKDKNIKSKYLAVFLNSSVGQNLIMRKATITTQAYLNNNLLSKIIIPVPPIDIQNKIVAIMDKAYATKKDNETTAKALLDSIDDYVLGELGIEMPEVDEKMCFVVKASDVSGGRIDPYYYKPKFEVMAERLESGKYENKQLGNFINNIHYGASVKNKYVNSGIPFLRILNLKPNKIDISNVVQLPNKTRKELGNAFVKKGDMLISRSGTIGVVAVIPPEADGYAFGSFMIKFVLNNDIDKRYIAIWLNSSFGKNLIRRKRIGAVQGNITIPAIKSLKIPVPPIDIQNKIADEVSKRMEQAKSLEEEGKRVLDEAKAEVEGMILGGG